MKAILLAAGSGRRLRPATDTVPKCMVAFAGRPLIDHQIDTLHRAGISDFVVVTGYLDHVLRGHLAGRPGIQFVHNPEFETTNMVHSLMCARGHFQGDVLLAYTDILYGTALAAAMVAEPATLTIAYDPHWLDLWQGRMDDPLSDAETFRLDAHDHVVELGQKPRGLDQIQGQYMGLIGVRGDALAALAGHVDGLAAATPETVRSMYMTDLIQSLIDSGQPVKGVASPCPWLEVDTPSDLEFYEAMAAGRPGGNFFCAPCAPPCRLRGT